MKNKTIIGYFFICFIWSWVLWLPFVLPSFGVYDMTPTLEGLVMLAVMLGAFGPLLAAVILTFKDGRLKGVKEFFKKCFDFRVNYKYYLLAFVFSLGITASVHYFVTFTGIDHLPINLVPSGVDIPIILLILPYTLMLLFLGGGQEEFGWRGFIQEPLQDKIGVIKASVVIGLLWSLWHLPLWFIPGEGHAYYSFIAFTIYTTGWSVILGIMYNLAGRKMTIPWVMHTLGNLSVPLFPILFLEDVPQPAYWIWALTNAVVAIIFGIWYERRRLLR